MMPILTPLIIAIGAAALLILDLYIGAKNSRPTGLVAAVIFFVALLALTLQEFGTSFSGMLVTDATATFVDGLICVIGFVVCLLSLAYNEARGIRRGEFYVLMLFAAVGMMLVGHSASLLTIFLSIELLSIPLYVLCGIARPDVRSEESSLKYFLLGAFASGFLIFGIALLYGATGTVDLTKISEAITAGKVGSATFLMAGAALILVGLSFKVAAVPFHMWTPDVYDGAPTTVTAFMTTATKAAGFAAIVRVFFGALLPAIPTWAPVMAILAAATMIVGNLLALAQSDLKRMLAYSSIAHAGYLLTGIASGVSSLNSVLFYLAAYAMTSLAAFGVMTAVNNGESENHSLNQYDGLAKREPLFAWVMAIALFSLMGMPLTAGFAGKYLLFQTAVANGFSWLAIIGVITSVVSAYYYLRVIVNMFFKAGEPRTYAVATQASAWVPALMAIATVGLGVLPGVVLGALPTVAQSVVR